ncbi:MAG: hypothetical protein HFI37_05050 [Lachnospiraceae bacterium]|nr:hypothetical protein [Lachnospiraceae bacterium]
MYAVQNNTSVNIYQTANTNYAAKTKKTPQKPVWNPNRVFHYLEDMNRGFLSYGEKAVSYYREMIAGESDGSTLSIEELKAQISEYFPEYTLIDHEPSDVKDGKFYLYIDEKNLQKLASDPEYRAKVYGLMDRELQGKNGYTLQYSDGRNVTSHLTGTIFSLAETNKKYAGADEIPYRGSAKSDNNFSTSDSHPKVQNMGFLYDHMNPAKSSAKDRKANTAKLIAKRLKKKALEKKHREHMAKRREDMQRHAQKLQAEKIDTVDHTIEQMKIGAKYKTWEDIQPADTDKSSGEHSYASLSEFTSYLAATYETFGNGITTVSKSYLRKCLSDEEERKKLEEMLSNADAMEKNGREHLKGYLGMKVHIDENGKMESETYGASVGFPEGKRAAQIDTAMSSADIQAVMILLEGDLSECEDGVKKGFCDETEVQKVKAMMERAAKKQKQIEAQENENPDTKNLSRVNILI